MRLFGFDVRRSDSKAYDIQSLARDVGFGGGASDLQPLKIVEEAYRSNPTAYSAVRKVSSAAAAVPWVPQSKISDEPQDYPAAHPVRALLEKPNPWHPWTYVTEAMVGSLLLFGEAYAYLNGPGDPKQIPGRPPTEVLWLPKQWVERRYNERTWQVTGYTVNTRDGQVDLPAHRVVDPIEWNPLTPWLGQGRIQSSAASIDTANLGRLWNRRLLEQSARPPGVLETDGSLTDAVYQRLQLEVDRKFSGPKGAGKPMILDGGLKWKQTGLTAADMDFQNGLREVKREIALDIGVDPSMLGDPEVKTYANYQEARVSLYEDTVLPVLSVVRHAFLLKLRQWFPDLWFHLDTDKVPALAEARRKTWSGLADLVDRGVLTRNEARREMGFNDVDGGDDILVNLSLVPLSEAGLSAGIGGDEEEDEEPADLDTPEAEEPAEA